MSFAGEKERGGVRINIESPADLLRSIGAQSLSIDIDVESKCLISDPYVCLWRAVLLQCIIDVRSITAGSDKIKINNMKCAREAFKYIISPENKHDIINVCEFAQVCPKRFYDRFMLEAQPFIDQEEARKGGA